MRIFSTCLKKGFRITILLQESCCKEGNGLKRTIENLSNCTLRETEAIKLVFSHKERLRVLGGLSESLKLR
ncbi:MAG: hypothetical protein HRU72_15030 [Planctomycetia bacterium]|nr:hypothetical protein [Candidatus Brocadia sp.]MEB2309055.1 hypothetical protein [Candidatus Brocadiaceae bacterium]QOJ05050.1 MAG: hypothetical protein HRU72_15030 [Planctomycetia bacterium]HQU30347.1 hypothetical protein [Candidatus Brocadia sapporoensis]